jgi:predicted O-methyltransferase YrrM
MESNHRFKPVHSKNNSGLRLFYLHNKYQITQKLTGKYTRPWMKEKEIEVIWELLKNRNPDSCLEWGCGYSTLFYPKIIERPLRWLSIEHSGEWADEIIANNQDPDVRIQYVPASDSFDGGEGTYEEFADYLEFPEKEKYFDFILIDGRARKHCVAKAYEYLSEDGIVVVHDANRKSYLEYTDKFAHQLIFTDYRSTAGGLWIGSKGVDISDLLNVEHHRKAWDVQTQIGRMIRFKFIKEPLVRLFSGTNQ